MRAALRWRHFKDANMTLFARPGAALIFGAFIACAETCLHFESLMEPASWFDLPIHDWLAAALLIYGGVVSGKDWRRGRPYLAAGWAFMASLLFAAFVGHWEELSQPPQADEWIPLRAFVGIIGGLLLFSSTALVATLRRESEATAERLISPSALSRVRSQHLRPFR